MADERKISDLTQLSTPNDGDEMVVVNKAVTEGQDASATGQTSKITLGDLKEAIGSQGAQGDQGPIGLTGPTGATGAKGETGSTGDTGAPGLKGDDGGQGEQGTQGSAGADGPGFTGGAYNASTGVVTFTHTGAGLNVQTTDIRGADGVDGTPGAPGVDGDQGPVGPVGPDGSPWGGGNFTGGVQFMESTVINNSGVQLYNSKPITLANGDNHLSQIARTDDGLTIKHSGVMGANEPLYIDMRTCIKAAGAGLVITSNVDETTLSARADINPTEYPTLEGGQLTLGYAGRPNIAGEGTGTWNIDSITMSQDYAEYDQLRFFTKDLNEDYHVPMTVSPIGVTISSQGRWAVDDKDGERNLHDLTTITNGGEALQVFGGAAYQIEVGGFYDNTAGSHPTQSTDGRPAGMPRGFLGVDGNGFMRINGVGDGLEEGSPDEDSPRGHNGGVGLMDGNLEIARFQERGIVFHRDVEFKGTITGLSGTGYHQIPNFGNELPSLVWAPQALYYDSDWMQPGFNQVRYEPATGHKWELYYFHRNSPHYMWYNATTETFYNHLGATSISVTLASDPSKSPTIVNGSAPSGVRIGILSVDEDEDVKSVERLDALESRIKELETLIAKTDDSVASDNSDESKEETE